MTEKMTDVRRTKSGMVKYGENPFLKVDEIKGKNKQVRFSSAGNQVMLNTDTGEMAATHVTSWRQVDDEEFVKLFTANIALTFNLSTSGRKMFDLLLRVMQKNCIGKDQVYLNDEVREEALEEFPKLRLGKSTFYRGIDNLIENQIIARSKRTNIYYINPHLVFNGDRLTFTQNIIRKKSKSESEQIEDNGE